MSVHRENTGKGSWYVMVRYTDYRGKRRQKCRRGFKTKREAFAWEQQFKYRSQASMDMTLESFFALYEKDVRPRLKQNSWLTKENIFRTKIIPYLGRRKMSEITARDVIDWQNEMMSERTKHGRPYSGAYLVTIHAHLSSLFNHAMKYYSLGVNPAKKAGVMKRDETREMNFWTKEEYLKFQLAMMQKPMSYYAFEMLYWCGIREGELLALTTEDFDFAKRTVRINKSYQRIRKKDVITTPKTPRSVRTIRLPDFLAEEMKNYIKNMGGGGAIMPGAATTSAAGRTGGNRRFTSGESKRRIFPVTKHYLTHEMQRGCRETGVKRIRIHDLRHSHVSLLMDMGFTALAIGDRVGHSGAGITYRYAHLFPTVQDEMARRLDMEHLIE